MERACFSGLIADGESLLNNCQPDAAAVLFHQATRLRPDDASAHNWLGLAQLAAGELVSAEAAFDRALQLAPCEPLYHVNYGTALKGRTKGDAHL
jgi:Flp pilus assembly protein TadD